MAFLRYATVFTSLSFAVPEVLAAAPFNDAPQKALLPALHWDRDPAHLQHLLPVDNHQLYYSDNGVSDPTLEHVFAHLTTNLTHPAVILDHSNYVKSVECAGKDLKITFTNSQGYDFAAKAWASEKDFILATYAEGCGTSDDQRTFWQVDYVTPGSDNIITAVVDHEIATEDALHTVDLVWGTYSPAQGTKKRSQPRIHKRQTAGPTNDACGPPSAKTIDGIPATTCGSPTFDKDLDDAIGYFDFSPESYSESLEGFAPGLGDFASEDNLGFGATVGLNGTILNRRSTLHKRGVLAFLSRMAAALARTVDNTAAALTNIGRNVNRRLTTTIQKLANGISVAPSISLKYNLQGYGPRPKELKQTNNFGKQLRLYKYKPGKKTIFAVYCVDCGISGQINIGGQARWSVGEGVTIARVQATGDLRAGLTLGLEGQFDQTQQTTIPIFSAGIPGLSIPKVITIGPSIFIEAQAAMQIQISGTLKAGIAVTIPVFEVDMDFLVENGTLKNDFTPKVDKIFETQAQASIDIALGIPFGFAVGIIVPPAKNFRKAVTLNNRPYFSAVAKFAGGNVCQADNSCLNGVQYGINFNNNITIDLFGAKQYLLSHKQVPFLNDCRQFQPRPNLNCPATPQATPPNRRSTLDPPKNGYPLRLGRRQDSDSDSGTAATASAPESSSSAVAPISGNLADTSMFAFGNITLGGGNDTSDDEMFQELNRTALESIDTNSLSNISTVPYPADTEFVTIKDLDGNEEVEADADGNVYYAAVGQGSPFALISNIIEADAGGRFFHYYTDVMEKYNVSRLRLSKEQHIPLTSDFVGFVPVNYNNDNTTADVYIAADSVNNIFYPINCDIQNQNTKVFLARDIDAGSQTLMDPILRNIVTGGVVERCYFVPWAASPGSGIQVPTPDNPNPVYPLMAADVDSSLTMVSVSASIGSPVPPPTGAPAAVTLAGDTSGAQSNVAVGTSSGEIAPTGAAMTTVDAAAASDLAAIDSEDAATLGDAAAATSGAA